LLGPDGILPIREGLADLTKQFPNAFEAIFRAPGLFWLNSSMGMIATLEWVGLAAAVALLMNFWPRLSLFICWLAFLSFVVTRNFFAATQPDQLMLEVALLCIPFAPAGYLPGLGLNAAPRRIAVFAIRFMLIRLMFEAGLAKFYYGADMWRDFTAMDVMYETAPFPTILGYLLHQLPHPFHVFEVLVTFMAEIPAPLLAVFGDRWGRWIAFWSWCALQMGIQVSCNFGWLNLAALGLGLVLLDDQMLLGLVRRLRLQRLRDYLTASVTKVPSLHAVKPWALWGLRVALVVQLTVALYFYLVAPTRIPPAIVPAAIHQPITLLFGGFRSANSYALFGNLPTTRYEVEFIGSNDGGETWRSYEYQYKVQRTDRICPFIAPWYPRFDAILQNAQVVTKDTVLYQLVAAQLLNRNPAVLALFRHDPFPERPAKMIRMPQYRYTFTDLTTLRATGNYWHKEADSDFAALVYVNARGEIVVDE